MGSFAVPWRNRAVNTPMKQLVPVYARDAVAPGNSTAHAALSGVRSNAIASGLNVWNSLMPAKTT
jgi:hypothetical protein